MNGKSNDTTPRTRYYLEIGRGSDWQRQRVEIDEPEQFYDLDFFLKEARECDLSDGFHSRVVDSSGKVYAHMSEPYEGITIDITDDSGLWLSDIRDDYGFSKGLFLRAVKNWLAEQEGGSK